MEVHNEHSLRSFPSFHEIDNFEEDDDDNNFVISLEDSGDDYDQKSNNLTPVCATACPVTHQPYNTYLNQAPSTHIVPCSLDVQNISSSSVCPSSADNISAYPRFIVSTVKNTAETELQSSVYSTSSINLRGCHQYSTDGVVPYSSCGPVSIKESGVNHQDEIAVTVSSSSIASSGSTLSVNCATNVIQPSKSLSESVLPQLHHNHQLYDESAHQSLSQQKLPSPSDLSKMHLETIYLDREAGGIWSEAIFLPSVPISDRGFTDIETDPNENVSIEGTNNDITAHERPQFITSNILSSSSHNFSSTSDVSSNCIPQLPVLHHKSTGPEHIMIDRTADFPSENEYRKTLKIKQYKKHVSCTCIMCYKENGKVKQCQGPYSEDPVLTEEEKLLIINKPFKIRGQSRPIMNNKTNKTSRVSYSNFGLQYQSVQTSFSNCPKTQSILSNLNSQYSISNVGLQATQYRDNRHISNLTLQPNSLTSARSILTGMLNKSKSIIKTAAREIITTDVLDGVAKPLVECEIPTTDASTSIVMTAPVMPRLVRAPTYRLNPTKVFLQPSEVLGQRSQSILPTPELTSINKVNMPGNGREFVMQPTVTCKEAQPCPPSSVTFSSPPSYKIIYVRPDQVLVCPNKASTNLNVMSLSKQPQTSTRQVTVLQLPKTSTQNKKLSPDSRQRAIMPNAATQFSPKLCLSSNGNIKSSSLYPNTQNDLRYVLKNAEKVDISKPGTVLIQLKTNDAAPPTSKSSVCTSLLKDFKPSQVKTTAPVNFPQACYLTPHPGHKTTTVTSPTVSKPTSMEVTQALMCLIKSHFQEQTPPGNENILMDLIKGSKQTSDSNTISHGVVPAEHALQQNIKTIESKHSNKHQTMTHKPIEDTQTFKSPEKNISETGVIYVNLDTISSPNLPQEGLPSSYVEDWVNQTKTYVSKHLNVSDCLSVPHGLNTSVSSGTGICHHNAFESSLDETSLEHDHLKDHMNGDMTSSILEEAVNQRKTLVLPKMESQNQPLSNRPSVVHIQKLQLVSNSTSGSSTTQSSNICRNIIQGQVDHPPTSHVSTGQNVQSFSMYTKSQAVTTDSQKPSHSESLTNDSPTQSSLYSDQSQNLYSQAPKIASSSMVVDSSKGIKLKIKLGEQRAENATFNQSYNTLDSGVKNGESVTGLQSRDESSFQKGLNISHQEAIIDEAKKVGSEYVDGDKTETAEEMFQRFQKQAEQEVLKAQMGIGYLSRSLRPTRTNLALIDKYPFGFGTGQTRNKIISEEKHVNEVSKHAGDNSSCCSLSEVDQQASKYNMQNKKSQMRNKRQADEVSNKEVKLKQPKLSIMDYPRLNQDVGITNRKKLFCSNILAGHKVYVKFNTYENVVSGRTFLVPFFNIGGTRTQFDVEDMEYINTAVMEFEKDERSCARHLLFYGREGQKASFLRKETHLQTSHVDDKNYKKSSFILEGFRRDTRKQTDHSPEQWKVDNTVDIEIDRAEIDNDAEMEFDADMNYNDVIHGLETHSKGVEEGRLGHVFNHSEYGGIKVNDLQNVSADQLSTLTNQNTHPTMILNELESHELIDCNQSRSLKTCAHQGRFNMEDLAISKLQQEMGSHNQVSLAPTLNSSVPFSGEMPVHSQKLKEFQYNYSDEKRISQGQFGKVIPSTILKQNTDEGEIGCSLEPTTYSAEVKQEEPDDGYESSIKHLESMHTAQNVCSTYFLPNTITNHCDQLNNKCNIAVKRELVDEYLDSSAETQSCSSENYQIEHSNQNIHNLISQHSRTLSYSHISSVFDSGIVHPKFVNCVSEKECTSNGIAAVPDQPSEQHSPFCHPSTHASVVHGQIAEPCTLTHHPLISRPHITENATLAKTEVTDSETNQLEQSLASINTEGLTSHVACKSVSVSTTSITELSLPESPLPSSSVSVSSEISASSDIDDRQDTTETGCLHTEPSVPEWTTEDGNKQNSIQNKITSLVESLRHRLTHDTSNLPPWLACTNTEVKKKKKLKIVKNSGSQSVSSQIPCSPAVPSQLSSTTTINLDETQSLSASAPPVLTTSLMSSFPTDSVPSATICPPYLPQDILRPITTCNLPANTPNSINNKNPMLLPVIQPTQQNKPSMKLTATTSYNDCSSIVGSISNKLVHKLDDSETEAPVPENVFIDGNQTGKYEAVLDETNSCFLNSAFESNPVNKCHNPSDCCESALSNNEHPECSETWNSYRQSPVDFEIEVGEEDLPDTALSLVPILPDDFARLQHNMEEEDESCQIGYLQPFNQISARRANSISARRKAGRAQLTEHEKLFIDGHNEASTESSRHEKGSVTNYLCQKFLLTGAGHTIKGPRLLHMPANNKAGVREHKTPKQNACKVNTISEPITVAELSKSPSVVEIFGISIGKESAITPDSKMNSPETHISHSALKSISNQQNLPPTALCQARVTKRATKRTGKKKTNCTSSGSSLKTLLVKPNIGARARKPSSIQHQSSHEVTKSDLTNELVLRMPICHVVLTKLETLRTEDVDKLSENVFLIKKDSIKNVPETFMTEKHSESSFATCSSKSTFRKVIKKRRKKTMTKRPVMRPKRDIVDYYASMLENLQKKAQLLEEESRRIAGENIITSITTSIEFQGMTDIKESAIIKETNNEEKEKSCIDVKMKEINEEMEETNKTCAEKLSNVQTEVDLSLQVAICSSHVAISKDSNAANSTHMITHANFADKDCSGSLMCEGLGGNDKTDAFDPTDHNLKERCDLGIQSEVSDIADSNWEFLQKFCDETIFNQGSTDYLQKINEEVCFPKIMETSVAELEFGKKDIVLGSSVSDETAHIEALGSSEILHEAEDTVGCLEERSDEQERDNLDEDEMLLGLDIPKSSAFGHEAHEPIKNVLSMSLPSELKDTLSSIDNESITGGRINSVNISSVEQVTNEAAAADEGALSSSVIELASTQAEPRGSIVARGPLNGDSQLCAKQRNLEVSPSWERLLGHSYHVIQQSTKENFSSLPEEPTNQDVSFVASSNFKCKFKLPKGILSKAIKMSRDMKDLFEKPSESLSNLEVSANSPVNQVLENNANITIGQSESIRNKDLSVDSAAQTCNNEKTTLSSLDAAAEVKFSSMALTAIQKVKVEFLNKRKRGRKPKRGLKVKHQSQNVSAQSDDHLVQEAGILLKISDRDQSSRLNQENLGDSYQKLQSVRSGFELLDRFPEHESCDLILKEDDPCSKACNSNSTALKQIGEDLATQTGDVHFPEPVFHAGKSTAGNALHNECLKQNRKDGIFSNIDFFHDFADEHAAKLVKDPPSNKEADDKILKNSVIDISKLKLKLNPLITSKLKEKTSHTSVDVLPRQLDSNSVLKTEVLPPGGDSIVHDECLPLECLELTVQHPECGSPVSMNVVQSHDKLETSSTEPQLLSLSTESPDHISMSTCKPMPQVNATRLCNFLKNFHKNVTTSSNIRPNSEGTLPDIDVSNSAVISSSSLLHPTKKSTQLDTIASTSKIVSIIKGRKKVKVACVPNTNEVVCKTRKAKEKANQKIQTASPAKVLLSNKLNVEHEESVCDDYILKNEDKGERSFFDCLSSLDAWEDKQKETQ